VGNNSEEPACREDKGGANKRDKEINGVLLRQPLSFILYRKTIK
jgi:hypothetical protein